MTRKLIIVFSLCFLFMASAMAGGGTTTYYSKLQVSTSDSQKGLVYVTSDANYNPVESDYKESFSETKSGEANQTYYLHALPSEEYELESWVSSSNAVTISGNTATIKASSTNQSSPTSATITANFRERTTAVIVSSNNPELGTATITEGNNAIGETITVTAAFIYKIPEYGGYKDYFSKSIKFKGWYDSDGNLLSQDMKYTFTVSKFTTIEGRFAYEPFLTSTEGYYRVRSGIIGWMKLLADYGPNFNALQSTDLSETLGLIYGNDSYIYDPGTIFRITGSKLSNVNSLTKQQTVMESVDMEAQGQSTYGIYKKYFQLKTATQPGFYKFYYSTAALLQLYQKMTIGRDKTDGEECMRLFDLEPLDEEHVDEFFFGVNPMPTEFEGGYWATMYTSFAYECYEPDGVEAYYVKEVTDQEGPIAIITKIDDGKVPANTAVLLKCQSTSPKQNRLIPLLEDPDFDFESKALKGSFQLKSNTVEKVKFSGESMKVLSVVDNEVGFYNIAEGTELGANKAWLDLSGMGVNAAKLRIKVDSGSTFVEGVSISTPAEDENAPIYNLQGHIVRNPIPGQIYIRNGKKFIAR